MGGLIGVVVVGSVVAYIMYQNINKVTSNIEKKSDKGYEFFANLAGAAIEYIKDIKRDLNGKNENPTFIAKGDNKKILDELDDFIRKLAFYETVLAKKKDIEVIEEEMAEIFIKFDDFIKNNFENGEQKADEIRESLKKIYENR